MKAVRFEEQAVSPSKILCVGRNYVEHVKELNNAIPDQMVVFNKPNSSISSTLRAFMKSHCITKQKSASWLKTASMWVSDSDWI